MQLRQELRPPPLDAALVAHLSRIADRLDRVHQREGDLADFNRLAGTTLAPADFRGIYKSENSEDFVRRVLFRRILAPDPNLTRAEMCAIISKFQDADENTDYFLELFIVNCRNPAALDLLLCPEINPEAEDRGEPSAEEIAGLAMRDAA